MRPKFVLLVFLGMGLMIGAIVFLKRAPVPVLANPEIPVADATNAVSAPTTAQDAPMSAPLPPVVAESLTPEQRQVAIDAEVNRLSDWAMADDPQSLSNIVNDLRSPEKEIRVAAVEAAKQFQSTNAIPALRAAAAESEDTQEAIAMLEAIDWLALPSAELKPSADKPQLTDAQLQAIEANKAKVKARQEAQPQKHNSNQSGVAGQSAQPETSAGATVNAPGN